MSIQTNNIFELLGEDPESISEAKSKKPPKRAGKAPPPGKKFQQGSGVPENPEVTRTVEKKKPPPKNVTKPKEMPAVVPKSGGQRQYDKKSGTGRGKEIKKQGHGRTGWGTHKDAIQAPETYEEEKQALQEPEKEPEKKKEETEEEKKVRLEKQEEEERLARQKTLGQYLKEKEEAAKEGESAKPKFVWDIPQKAPRKPNEGADESKFATEKLDVKAETNEQILKEEEEEEANEEEEPTEEVTEGEKKIKYKLATPEELKKVLRIKSENAGRRQKQYRENLERKLKEEGKLPPEEPKKEFPKKQKRIAVPQDTQRYAKEFPSLGETASPPPTATKA